MANLSNWYESKTLEVQNLIDEVCKKTRLVRVLVGGLCEDILAPGAPVLVSVLTDGDEVPERLLAVVTAEERDQHAAQSLVAS